MRSGMRMTSRRASVSFSCRSHGMCAVPLVRGVGPEPNTSTRRSSLDHARYISAFRPRRRYRPGRASFGQTSKFRRQQRLVFDYCHPRRARAGLVVTHTHHGTQLTYKSHIRTMHGMRIQYKTNGKAASCATCGMAGVPITTNAALARSARLQGTQRSPFQATAGVAARQHPAARCQKRDEEVALRRRRLARGSRERSATVHAASRAATCRHASAATTAAARSKEPARHPESCESVVCSALARDPAADAGGTCRQAERQPPAWPSSTR